MNFQQMRLVQTFQLTGQCVTWCGAVIVGGVNQHDPGPLPYSPRLGAVRAIRMTALRNWLLRRTPLRHGACYPVPRRAASIDRRTSDLRSQQAWRRLRVRLLKMKDQPSPRRDDQCWPARTVNAVELLSLSLASV